MHRTNPAHPNQPDRQRHLAAVLAHPEEHKVCEGCGSVVWAGAGQCPRCHHYRFDTDPGHIAKAAKAIARRKPDPLTYHDLDGTDE